MPRILITGFCSLPGPNRAGAQMRHVLHALSQHHNVDVLVLRRGDQAYVERMGNARILRVPAAEGDSQAQVEAFRRALRRQLEGSEYDIVHFRDGWSGMPVLEMQPTLKYATVFDVARSPMSESPSIDLEQAAELAEAEQACLAGADLVLVGTDAARAHVERDQAGRVWVVPPGVDIDQFDWDEPEPGPPIVLCAGSLGAGRGVRVLLRAMAYVLAEVPAHLVFAGAMEPEFRKSIESAAWEMSLRGHVTLLGEVEHADMPALIARATVCVAPAAPESRSQPLALYPTKLLEYMACRRAVVAPRRGTTAMLIDHGVHGLTFEPGDPLELSTQLLALLKDADTRARLAEAGYQLVRQHHSASTTRRALRRAYQALIERVSSQSAPAEITAAPAETQAAPPAPTTQPEAAVAEPAPTTQPEAAVAEPAAHAPHALHVGDSTDEYIVLQAGREPQPSFLGDTGPGEITAVELRVRLQTSDLESPWPEPAVSAVAEPASAPGASEPAEVAESEDEWVVGEWDRGNAAWRSLLDLEDESTPIDGRVPQPPAPPDHSVVSGELVVSTPPPQPADLDLAEETSFTAVSVLLGSHEDDPPRGAGRDEPA